MKWFLNRRNKKIIKNSVPWTCSRCGWHSKGYVWVCDDVVVEDCPELFIEDKDGRLDLVCRHCANDIYEMDVLSMMQGFDEKHGIGESKATSAKTPVYGSVQNNLQ